MYIYRIEPIDKGGRIGKSKCTEVIYKYPVDVIEFIKDVDYTIAHAQSQIPNFGKNGSEKNVLGSIQGKYEYSATITSAKSSWKNYSSFGIILNGETKITISVYLLGAIMDGTVKISGLYEGEVVYHNLLGQIGGITAGGALTARYNHPEKGWLEQI